MAETPAEVMAKAYEKAIRGASFTGQSKDQMLELGMRAALRALADQFNDPVVKTAILAAAEEGEKL
jgi:hypothetical protein